MAVQFRDYYETLGVPKTATEDEIRAGNANFIEVFVNAPLDVCERRDPKGIYKKAKKGEIKEFTGISAPYEEPLRPELTIETDKITIEQCLKTICDYLVQNGYLGAQRAAGTPVIGREDGI